MTRPPCERLSGRDASAVASWGDRNPMRGVFRSLFRTVNAPRDCRDLISLRIYLAIAFEEIDDTVGAQLRNGHPASGNRRSISASCLGPPKEGDSSDQQTRGQIGAAGSPGDFPLRGARPARHWRRLRGRAVAGLSARPRIYSPRGRCHCDRIAAWLRAADDMCRLPRCQARSSPASTGWRELDDRDGCGLCRCPRLRAASGHRLCRHD
ncbi:hypothetical protein ABIA14_006014 [Sinorhizobium fredii]